MIFAAAGRSLKIDLGPLHCFGVSVTAVPTAPPGGAASQVLAGAQVPRQSYLHVVHGPVCANQLQETTRGPDSARQIVPATMAAALNRRFRSIVDSGEQEATESEERRLRRCRRKLIGSHPKKAPILCRNKESKSEREHLAGSCYSTRRDSTVSNLFPADKCAPEAHPGAANCENGDTKRQQRPVGLQISCPSRLRESEHHTCRRRLTRATTHWAAQRPRGSRRVIHCCDIWARQRGCVCLSGRPAAAVRFDQVRACGGRIRSCCRQIRLGSDSIRRKRTNERADR